MWLRVVANLLASVVLVGCAGSDDVELNASADETYPVVGQPLPDSVIMTTIPYFPGVTALAGYDCAPALYLGDVNGVRYSFGVRGSGSALTVCTVWTTDSTFVSPEGVRVGTSRDAVAALAPRPSTAPPRAEPAPYGRHAVFALPSGWQAAVMVEDRDGAEVEPSAQAVGVVFQPEPDPWWEE